MLERIQLADQAGRSQLLAGDRLIGTIEGLGSLEHRCLPG